MVEMNVPEDWLNKMREVIAACWETDEFKLGMDRCPRCSSDELRGYENHNLIACRICEWTIDRVAWLEAWK